MTISAHPGQALVPLPEGSRYVGFIFARAASPEAVEGALREAHRCLEFDVDPPRRRGPRRAPTTVHEGARA